MHRVRNDCDDVTPSTSTSLRSNRHDLSEERLWSSDSEEDEPLSSLVSSRAMATSSAPPAKKKKTTQWKKQDPTFTCTEFQPQESSEESKVCQDPLQFFKLFFHQDLITLIAKQTNLYALQKNKSLMVTEDEIYVVIGAMLLSGYVKLPNKR